MADDKDEKGDKPTLVPPQKGRRRVLHAGLGATPIFLTLVSRPVLGSSLQCTTPSGFVSMPASRSNNFQQCLGRTPGFWKQEQKFPEWPAPPYYPVASGPDKATRFNQHFTPISAYNNATTFLDVLKTEGLSGHSGPPHSVARHCVAALLNAAKGWTPVLTEADVKNIWNEYATTGAGTMGYFTPTAGVKWYHDQIVEYLTSTMTL